MKKVQRSRLAAFLFNLLWHILSYVSPATNRLLLSIGFKDGAFDKAQQPDDVLSCTVLNQLFKTPVGIAVDFSDSEQVIDSLIDMGLGFGEFGPYTLEAEDFDSKTFFVRKKQAIVISSNGYTNPGLSSMVPFFLHRRRLSSLVGVNIMARASSELDNIRRKSSMSSQEELEIMVQKIAPYCDYITVNAGYPTNEPYTGVSNHSIMIPLLDTLKKTAAFIAPYATPKIFLKIPIDLSSTEIDSICEIVLESGIAGVVIAGPHALSRSSDPLLEQYASQGNCILFGRPTKDLVTHLVRTFYGRIGKKCTIIAVGGISSGKDVFEKMAAGASLVQINSAFFFKGPQLINDINRDLAKLVKEKGFLSASEIIGTDPYHHNL